MTNKREITTDVITRLRPSTRYVLSIAVINENGQGPAATVEVWTKPAAIGMPCVFVWFCVFLKYSRISLTRARLTRITR